MKSLRILIASSFLLTACSVAPALEQEEAASTSEATRHADLFLVDLEDNGANGTLIGCGDSLVSVPYTVSEASSREDAIRALLQMPKEDPETGFYNALAGTNLTIDSIEMNGDIPTLYLTGTLSIGGACEVPRIEEQLKATLLQGATTANIYINGVLLHDALSSK